MSATNGMGTASPLQLARYGHLAKTLREALDRKGWSVGDLNRRLGRPASHASIYQYLSARCGPLPGNAEDIAHELGIPVATLLARGEAPATAPAAPQPAPGGEVHIKLELTVAMKDVATVLRLLLDAGLLPTSDIL